MKEYIVNNDKLRNAMKKVAKNRNTNMSAILNATDGLSDSAVTHAEMRYEKNKDETFDAEQFTSYGLYYEDTFNKICETFCIQKEVFIEKTCEVKEKRLRTLEIAFKEIDALSDRVSELEDFVLKLMLTIEEMRRVEQP